MEWNRYNKKKYRKDECKKKKKSAEIIPADVEMVAWNICLFVSHSKIRKLFFFFLL